MSRDAVVYRNARYYDSMRRHGNACATEYNHTVTEDRWMFYTILYSVIFVKNLPKSFEF